MNERDRPSRISWPALVRVLDDENQKQADASAILADEMAAIVAREPDCKWRREQTAVLTQARKCRK